MTQSEQNPAATLGHYSDTEWDITTGVGYTALAVTAGRAMETRRPDPLLTDPHAAGFVDAVQIAANGSGVSLPTEWPPDTRALAAATDGIDPDELAQVWESMATYQGVRSRYFDDYFQEAVHEAGIRQVVLLAAGLDARAHRIDWPAGTQVFEIDHANVLAFKDQVLTTQNVEPGCARHVVGVDLRDDWPAALRDAGFDPNAPTAWLAEGLLFFLPDEAKQLLCQRVQTLSAPGSQWAIESMLDPAAAMNTMLQDNTILHQLAAQFGADPTGLWPEDQQWEPHTWLVRNGWTVTTATAHTVAARYQRTLEGPGPMTNHEHPGVLLSAVYEHPYEDGAMADEPE